MKKVLIFTVLFSSIFYIGININSAAEKSQGIELLHQKVIIPSN